MPALRYSSPPSALFERNRARLCALLPKGALAVVHANDRQPTNADGTMPFRQNSNFYYLTGIDQAESIVLLYPSASDENLRALLFVRKTTPELAVWEGDQLTITQAGTASGIKNVCPLQDFEQLFHRLMCEAESLYLESNEHYRAHIEVETRNARFVADCARHYPLHARGRLAPLLAALRSTKADEELAQIREACRITAAGFDDVLACVRPGMMEYEVEARYAQAFLSRGSRGFAYAPIIASGANACVLHYDSNAVACKDGDLLLMDVGAEYGNYCADMTRTIPVGGRFTKRQLAVYEAVLAAFRYAKSLLQPGVVLTDYQKQVEHFIAEQLVSLGLLTAADIKTADKKTPAHKQYFMHGVSHHLGLDVHDVPLMHVPLTVGAVLTIEPGIYIREENIGIRLENDVRITETGCEDLMADIPIEAEDIQERLNRN